MVYCFFQAVLLSINAIIVEIFNVVYRKQL